MGTKKEIAPDVCEVIRNAKPGIFLDAFAGMCSVAEKVGVSRQIWTNDVQIFASEIGRALFVSHDEPLETIRAADFHFETFDQHRQKLSKLCSRSLMAEDEMLDSSDFDSFQKGRSKSCNPTSPRSQTTTRS
jgi:adenine-specific DNA-methyltransferase